MRIITLVENTKSVDVLGRQHGLSFYIETKFHKLLFDLGQDDLFLANAKKLGIDINAVDMVVISHGHYDHGGGLKAFLKVNQTAKIYVQESAFEDYYSMKLGIHVPIGLSKKLKNHPQVVLIGDNYVIDDELRIFSNIQGRILFSSSNQNLMMEESGKYVADAFHHEQVLIITEEKRNVLLVGCAHNGIINIMDKAEAIIGQKADVTIGGFHLYSPGGNKYEPEENIKQIAQNLLARGGKYYTCHCTGEKAYQILKAAMGEQIGYASTGTKIEI